MTTSQDIHSPNPGAIVELYTLDASSKGQGIFNFSPNSNELGTGVVFSGTTYAGIPVAGEGWTKSTNGAAPRPTITVDNTQRAMQAAVIAGGDLVNCPLTRTRVFSQYLDAANFKRWNLLNYSEQFDNAYWTKENASITANTVTGPDGTSVLAETLTSTVTGGSNTAFTERTVTVLVSTHYTFSVYLKQGTSPTSTVDFYTVSPYQESVAVVTWGTTPTIAVSGNATHAASITDAGNGWYRVSVSLQSGSATSAVCRVYVRDQGTANVTGHTVYLYGAQLEVVSGASNTLNLLTFPEDMRNTAEAGVSRPWTQFVDADTDVLRVVNTAGPFGVNVPVSKLRTTTTGSAQRQIQQTLPGLASDSYYTLSVYAKAAETNFLRLQFSTKVPNYPGVDFNLSTGALQIPATAPVPINAGCDSVGNGWYRCWATFTTESGASTPGPLFRLISALNGTNYNSPAVGNGVLLYGAQLVEGKYALNYVPINYSPSAYQATTTTHRPSADPTQVLSTEKFVINRKLSHNNVAVRWELCWAIDKEGVKLPRRQVLRNYGFPGVQLNS
jgi:phage-related protein